MKKILINFIILLFILNVFSFVSFADESYDSTWTITTDKLTYNAGDYLTLKIKNSKQIDVFNGASIHFTFDKNLLEYVTDDDVIFNLFDVEAETLPGLAQYGTSSGGELTKDGEFIDTVGSAGSKIREGKDVYTVYFKVKEDIEGTHELNFRWILNSKDFPSWVVRTEQGTTSDVETYLDINFVDASVVINGKNMEQDNSTLSSKYTYASATKNDLEGKTIEINGVTKSISSDYAIAFARVAPRNNGVTKVKAGFILSANNTTLTVNSKNAKIFEAVNFASDSIFAGLFHGPGLKAGTTYYVMPYVTYSDGVTLYAPQVLTFTMPE